jgi:hypothetical protein
VDAPAGMALHQDELFRAVLHRVNHSEPLHLELRPRAAENEWRACRHDGGPLTRPQFPGIVRRWPWMAVGGFGWPLEPAPEICTGR